MTGWHVPTAMLDAYIADRITAPDAWSVETHLVACESCRAVLVAGAEPVDADWASLVVRLPTQGRARRATRMRQARLLLASGPGARVAWLVASLVLLGLAGGLRAVFTPWLGVLVPFLAVLGVAASYGTGLDDAHEAVAATPGGGLRLVLIRTVSVLAMVIPVSIFAGLASGYGSPLPWLTATLGLTLLTLAFGSAVGVDRAAVAVAISWAAVTGIPLLAELPPVLLAAGAAPVWLAVAVIATVVVAVRRHTFHLLPPGSEVSR